MTSFVSNNFINFADHLKICIKLREYENLRLRNGYVRDSTLYIQNYESTSIISLKQYKITLCLGCQCLLGGSGGKGAPSSNNGSLFTEMGGSSSRISLAVSSALVIVDITTLSNFKPLFAKR